MTELHRRTRRDPFRRGAGVVTGLAGMGPAAIGIRVVNVRPGNVPDHQYNSHDDRSTGVGRPSTPPFEG